MAEIFIFVHFRQFQHNGEKAMGVKVKKGSETYELQAPIIISTAGVYNTFLKLLPQNVAQKSYYHKVTWCYYGLILKLGVFNYVILISFLLEIQAQFRSRS